MSVYTVENIFKNYNVGYMGTHLFLAIASAVATFKYLQTTGSVSVMHSMPFSRKTLYFSSYLSGLKIAYIPAFLNGLVLLLLKTPVYKTLNISGASVDVDIFTFSGIFSWMLESFVIIAFLYSIAVFAGIVTGTVVMHVLTAGGFNFLLGALFMTFLAYFQIYAFGFTSSTYIDELALRLSAYTYVFKHGGNFGTKAYILYLLVAIMIAIATYFIYKRRALERATDSTTFKFMEYFIAVLISFFSSSLVGLIFYENDYGYGGYILGGALGFIVGQMIVKKTMKIFNMESLRAFIIFVGIMALILIGFRTDLLGYERNIPKLDNVKSVEMESYSLNFGQYPVTFEDSENIQSVINFHETIVAGKADYRNFFGNGLSISLKYVLTNGRQLERQYYLPYSVFAESLDFKQFIESEEADRRTEKLKALDLSSTQIDFGGNFNNTEALTLYYSDDVYYNNLKAGILESLALDTAEMTAEEILSNNIAFLRIEVMNREKVESEYTYTNYSFGVTRYYEHTIEWLQNNGYSRLLSGVGENDFAIITEDSDDPSTVDAITKEIGMNEKYNDVYVPTYTPEDIDLLKKDHFVIVDRDSLSDLLINYAAMDTRYIEDATNILRLNMYSWYDYGETSHYEYTGMYYLDKTDLPQEIMLGLLNYL
ncbi:MAG: hypothetical protein EOM59_00390 [Clostridia bacterium]|nr:hypothetical protein [Clostridia bacterium]